MKTAFITAMIAMIALISCGGSDSGEMFPDPALKACIEDELNSMKQVYGKDYKIDNLNDLAQITYLACGSAGVTSLKGIEHLSGVTEINFFDNKITDLTPLQKLPKMNTLRINQNHMTSIETIGNPSVLDHFVFDGNYVKDIKPLLKIGALKSVTLIDNCITDTDTLAQLKAKGVYIDDADLKYQAHCNQ